MFLFTEKTPLACFKIGERKRTERNALKRANGVPNGFAHTADLTIAPLVDRDLEKGMLWLTLQQLNLRWLRRTVFEHDPAAQRLKRTLANLSAHQSAIGLWHMMARMDERISQLPIVGEEQKPRGVLIEPADREQPREAFVGTSSETQRPPCASDIALRYPAGLLSMSTTCSSGSVTRVPSSFTTSQAGSIFVPISRTTSPFTLTRPEAMSVSEARLLATPARARNFWRRTGSTKQPRYSSSKLIDSRSIFSTAPSAP